MSSRSMFCAAVALSCAVLGTSRVEAATPAARELLARAEALNMGAGGHYDPAAALALYEQAAASGDPLAMMGLALQLAFRDAAPGDRARAEDLCRRSATEVERLAAAGDGMAQTMVGSARLLGLGGAKDERLARQWYEKGAANGQPWALHDLAYMKETGEGGPKDLRAALELYRRAAELGNVRSMQRYAWLTFDGEGSGGDCARALRWLGQAARAGSRSAAGYYGGVLAFGREGCVPADPQAAVPWLQAGAAEDPSATFNLALALLGGVVKPAGLPAPAELLETQLRSDRPLPISAEMLAFVYGSGVGAPRDAKRGREMVVEAARLGTDGFPNLRQLAAANRVFQPVFRRGLAALQTLADDKDAAAAAMLAHFYSSGVAAEPSPGTAVRLAQLAASAGEADAMRVLSYAYESGDGVDADPAESLRWLIRGAQAGDSFCMMFYSQRLMRGNGVPRDVAAGVQWLERSGEAGNYWAAGDLGHLYDEGWYGVPRDEDKAVKWKRLRARRGDEEARGWLRYHNQPLQ